jgi:hypothetical protein
LIFKKNNRFAEDVSTKLCFVKDFIAIVQNESTFAMCFVVVGANGFDGLIPNVLPD